MIRYLNINFIDDFLNIVYPKICVSCDASLFKHEFYLCNKCKQFLPKATCHLDVENSLIRKILYGRIPVSGSAAYYLFSKKTGVQKILHHIKYKQGKELAYQIGKWMGNELKQTDWIKDIDGFIPIPLHPRKQIERGYNQSEVYSRGLEDEIHKPVLNILSKGIYNTTQTRKKRYERWENVKDNFTIQKAISDYQHIVLVDDVITTGATFESAYNSLRNSGYQGKISIVTMAVATHLI